ncbi:hypothetical protein K466DRAFT_503537 [Polyporus arcularius HHB13444]|uniref:Aspartic peptidase DDI1-type domain-containing protein n=1 Tax=Polyporus arcularius HHB13444 TaxID=1314778 RepID=A0A5C3NV31_9APHY|nr:hypothetical protein K466DRAFT_503537 [Polyporus arcularius HHB13444]
MRPKDASRMLPVPLVVEVMVNDKPVRALLDIGCMADFISTTITDQLKVKTEVLESPLPVYLAVQGSRLKINRVAEVNFKYQVIDCSCRFDVVNVDNYDMILGTPFLFQHQVAIGLNPTHISIGSVEPKDIEGEDTTVILSAAATVLTDTLERLREQLCGKAEDLCQDGARAELPLRRAINHTIPLIDENKVYSWRPSRCPDPLRPLWQEKRNMYLESEQWRMAS